MKTKERIPPSAQPDALRCLVEEIKNLSATIFRFGILPKARMFENLLSSQELYWQYYNGELG